MAQIKNLPKMRKEKKLFGKFFEEAYCNFESNFPPFRHKFSPKLSVKIVRLDFGEKCQQERKTF
jgi:hypothetical protein